MVKCGDEEESTTNGRSSDTNIVRPASAPGRIIIAYFIILMFRECCALNLMSMISEVEEEKWRRISYPRTRGCNGVAHGRQGRTITPLHTSLNYNRNILIACFFHFLTWSLWMYQWTDRPMERRTKPLIELWVNDYEEKEKKEKDKQKGKIKRKRKRP